MLPAKSKDSLKIASGNLEAVVPPRHPTLTLLQIKTLPSFAPQLRLGPPAAIKGPSLSQRGPVQTGLKQGRRGTHLAAKGALPCP